MENNQTTSNDKSKGSQSQMYAGTTERSTSIPDDNTADVSRGGPSTASAFTPNGFSSNPRARLPPGTSLVSIFRYHMGIENDSELVPSHLASKHSIDPIATGMNKGRRAVNLGIYNRAIREERSSWLQFQVWSIVINLALGLQIIFAAILTALGAGGGPSDVVAIFGALNTIIAGFLTYLKGTGLPMRMKYFYNQWLKLRAYIEQRERDFASDDHLAVHLIGYTELMEEVQVIENMYQNIRKDIERHTPDNFEGSKGDRNDSAAPGEGAPESRLAKMGLSAFKAKLSRAGGASEAVDPAQHGVEGRIKSAVEDVERRISSHLTTHFTKLRERPQGGTKVTQYGAMRSGSWAKEQGGGLGTDLEANQEGSDSEGHDISDMELKRMKQKQAQALAAQRQAEEKIKELEQKLATMTDSKSDQDAG